MKKYLFIVLLVGVGFGQTLKQAQDEFRLRSNDAMPSEVLKNLIDIKSIVLSSFDVQKDTVIYSYGKGKNKKLASVRKDVSLHGDEKNFRKIKVAYKSVTNGWHRQEREKYKYDNVGNIVEVNRIFFDQIASKKKVVEYFEYDSNNQLIKRTEYGVDGNILLTSNYEYKNHGDVKEIQIYVQLGDVDISNLEIYKSGRLESISSSSIFLSTKRYYEYNKNGNIQKIKHYVINSNSGNWLSMEENFIWKNGLLDKYIKLEPGRYLNITNDDKLFPKLEYKFSNYKYYDISKGELNSGIKKGTWVEYNGDEKIEQITYIDGDENYDYVKYNSLGSEVAETGALRNGKPFGQKLVYSSDGYIWKKYVYKKGEQILKEEYYLSNSELLSYRKDLFWEENFGQDSEVISKKFIGRFSDFNGYYDGGWFIDSIPNVWAKGNVINGKMNGEWEFYYANKNLLAKVNYKNGDGTNVSRNGVPRNGRDALFEYWHENGNMEGRFNYISGKLDGFGEAWHENGKIAGRYNHISGKLEGLREDWYENGNMKERFNYKNGKLNGLYEGWYKNGQKSAIENYKDGKLDGLSEQWWENGNKKDIYKKINGKEDGIMQGWYENGNLRIKYNYKDGKKNGKQEWWHENGEKAGEWQFKSPGIRDESFKIKYWHKNGKKWRVGYAKTLKSGKHFWVGKYKSYKDDGTQIFNLKISKEDGKLISGWYISKDGGKYNASEKTLSWLPDLK